MNLGDALKQITKQEVHNAAVGTVQSVDEAAKTCVVEPLDGSPDLLDVRIDTNLNASEGFQLIPTVGSRVIVAFLDEDTAYVALTSNIDKFIFKTDQSEILASKDEVTLRKGVGEIVINSGETITLKRNTTEVAIDSSDLISIKTQADSLKGILNTLIQQIQTGLDSMGKPVTYADAFATTKAAINSVLS